MSYGITMINTTRGKIMNKKLTEADLHEYQLVARDFIIETPKSSLFLDMGLGKSCTTLSAIKRLVYDELEVDKVLIIAPKRVAESVWSAEIEKWAHLKCLRISKVIGTEKQRLAALKVKADIYTLGRDNVVWLVGQYGGNMLPFDWVVIDELSSFKNPKSMRFKALKKAIASVPRVTGLTGTPAPNGLIDLWSQIYLLDRGERLGKTITAYRERYFKPGDRNGSIIYKYDLQSDGEERIHDKINDIVISMKKEDYLDMPARISNYIEIDMPPALEKKYKEFEREMVLEILEQDTEISALNAAALSNKLLQFANGAVYDEDMNVHHIHDLKLDALDEIIEAANGHSVLIAWTYQHDRDRILSKYKDVVQLKTDQHIRDWNAGKIPLLMMHPASGGHGLNLQAGGHIIVWFGQTWSLELYQQFNARLDRQGQPESVIVNHLAVKGTIDSDVIMALERKAAGQAGLMEAVKARIAKYIK